MRTDGSIGCGKKIAMSIAFFFPIKYAGDYAITYLVFMMTSSIDIPVAEISSECTTGNWHSTIIGEYKAKIHC